MDPIEKHITERQLLRSQKRRERLLNEACEVLVDVYGCPRRLALDYVDHLITLSESPPERVVSVVLDVTLRHELRAGRMYWRRQEPVLVPWRLGRHYLPDFTIYQRDLPGRVLIECDGHAYHRRTPREFRDELRRERDLQRLGFRVLRYSAIEVLRTPWIVAAELIASINFGWAEFAPVRLPEKMRGWLSRLADTYREADEEAAEESPAGRAPAEDASFPLLQTEVPRCDAAALEEIVAALSGLPLVRVPAPGSPLALTRLARPRSHEPWSPEEDQLLREALAFTENVEQLAEAFGRGELAIRARATVLGVDLNESN